MKKQKNNLSAATFGAGCFWGIENAFMQTRGVIKTIVGYMGGKIKNPTYEEVCSDTTEHAEVVQVIYDSAIVTYEDLLQVFWNNHNPTTLNKDGPNVGTQYRSVIFFHTKEQEKIAQESKNELEKSKKYSKPIVTVIEVAKKFYPAEEYHQKYYQKKGIKSCHI